MSFCEVIRFLTHTLQLRIWDTNLTFFMSAKAAALRGIPSSTTGIHRGYRELSPVKKVRFKKLRRVHTVYSTVLEQPVYKTSSVKSVTYLKILKSA